MRPLTVEERRVIRSRISTALCNLGAFRAYWYEPGRCIIARSVSCARHFAVPVGARRIGIYERSAGATSADVLDDLEELLERLPDPVPPALTDPPDEPAKPPPACDAGDGSAIPAEVKATPARHPWRRPVGS